MSRRRTLYLSSTEIAGWSDVRECAVVGELFGETGRRYLQVRVEPAPPATSMVLTEPTNELILTERYVGEDLFARAGQPTVVYVAELANPDARETREIHEGDLRILTWGNVAESPNLLRTVARRLNPVDGE